METVPPFKLYLIVYVTTFHVALKSLELSIVVLVPAAYVLLATVSFHPPNV